MTKNMGTADRVLRAFVIAPLLLILAFFAVEPDSIVGIVLIVLAAVMAGTAAVGSCPLYSPFGLNTCAGKEVQQ